METMTKIEIENFVKQNHNIFVQLAELDDDIKQYQRYIEENKVKMERAIELINNAHRIIHEKGKRLKKLLKDEKVKEIYLNYKKREN